MNDETLGMLVCFSPIVIIVEIFCIWLGIQVMKTRLKAQWVGALVGGLFGLIGIIILALVIPLSPEAKVKQLIDKLNYRSNKLIELQNQLSRIERENPALAALSGAVGILAFGQSERAMSAIEGIRNIRKQIELERNNEELIRKEAALELGKINHPQGVQALIKALNDNYIEVRANAAISLGNCGDISAVESLLSKSNDQNEVQKVKDNAVLSLGILQGKN